MLRTVLVALWVPVLTVVCGSVSCFFSVWDKAGSLAHLVGRFWGRMILVAAGVRVRVQGAEHVSPSGSVVFMANHQSMFDIPVLFAHLPQDFRWLAKKELFTIPLFGYSMSKAGHISIDRSDRKSAHGSLHEASRKIAAGTSVVVFPEGSRSPDGQIMPFKPGGFHIASRSGRPIVPVVISGTCKVMRKGSLRITPARVVVSFCPPVDVDAYGGDKKALMKSVYSIMKGELERIRESFR
jgi:1-acyl-sn-glycerol-3-phosphate acyltransferase